MGGLEAAQTVKLMSFFPAHDYPFIQTAFREPQEYIDFIKKLRSDKTVFRLIISGTEINLPVRVQSFLYGEQDGSGDIEYSVTFGVQRELDTQEVAGWTLPKRKYDPPKSSGSSGKGKKKKKKDRVPQDTYEKPITIAHGHTILNGHAYNSANEDEVM